MVVVIVRQRQDVETAASALRQLRNDDAVTGVEPPAPRRPRIHEDEPAIRAAEGDGEPLSDVDDRGSAPPCGRPAQVERDRRQHDAEPEGARRPRGSRAREEPRCEQTRDVGHGEQRLGNGDAKVTAGDRGGGAGSQEERLDGEARRVHRETAGVRDARCDKRRRSRGQAGGAQRRRDEFDRSAAGAGGPKLAARIARWRDRLPWTRRRIGGERMHRAGAWPEALPSRRR
jgi:hypothetical protein